MRVAIVGGGVIGVSCAHYLRKAGLEPVVIEKATVGNACSRGNCGYVCPSHVLPLAGPGMIQKVIPLLLQKDSPLSVKARFDPNLWWWLFRFARRCNRRDMLHSAAGIAAMLQSSRRLYDDLFASERLEAEWRELGLLFVYLSEREMDHYAEVDHLLRTQFDTPATPYRRGELQQLEPSLKAEVAGAWHYRGDAHLRPDRLMSAWRRRLESNGVEFREMCEFQGLATNGRRVTAVKTSQGEIPVSGVVFAAGAWTPLMKEHLGCDVPIQPGKGYSITMARPERCPKIPMIFEEHRVAVTPMDDSYRIGSTMEFAGFDESLKPKKLELLRKSAALYLHEPTAEPVSEQWWGWRPMIHDGLPIIGRAPKYGNAWIAAGHGMLGLSMATGTGKLLAELMTDATPHIDPTPYRAERFSRERNTEN